MAANQEWRHSGMARNHGPESWPGMWQGLAGGRVNRPRRPSPLAQREDSTVRFPRVAPPSLEPKGFPATMSLSLARLWGALPAWSRRPDFALVIVVGALLRLLWL